MSKKNLKEIVYDSVLNSIYSSEYRANEIITEFKNTVTASHQSVKL